jgi:alkaline phosphatase D
MLGYNTMKEVQIWVQTTEQAQVEIEYWQVGKTDSVLTSDSHETNKEEAYTKRITLETEPGTSYEYRLLINNIEVTRTYPLTFTSQKLWRWREEAPDFNFAIGSCMYMNEPKYDRPGKPYGGDLGILTSIAEDDPDFMVWLGDNIYLREADWNSRTGIFHRYTHMRAAPELQPLLANTHHYAIWDDHDYGPNNSDRSYWGKKQTEEAFKYFWSNPNYDLDGGGGITGTFIWADCQFFLMDNRYHRSPPELDDRHILGEDQKQWLLDALLYSNSKYKFVCIGGQFLSDVAKHENHAVYARERQEIIDFIDRHKIEGVIFLTGDRHYSEISRLTTKEGVVMYDVTCSPLTSGTVNGSKDNNRNRVEGTLINGRCYAILDITGPYKERVVSVSYRDSEGKEIIPAVRLDFSSEN